MAGYHGIAKILFGVDEPAIPENQIASGLARLNLNGLRSPGDSSSQGGI
jgi:hypothetical protein